MVTSRIILPNFASWHQEAQFASKPTTKQPAKPTNQSCMITIALDHCQSPLVLKFLIFPHVCFFDCAGYRCKIAAYRIANESQFEDISNQQQWTIFSSLCRIQPQQTTKKTHTTRILRNPSPWQSLAILTIEEPHGILGTAPPPSAPLGHRDATAVNCDALAGKMGTGEPTGDLSSGAGRTLGARHGRQGEWLSSGELVLSQASLGNPKLWLVY